MRNVRAIASARRGATPHTRQGDAPRGIRRPQRRLLPILAVLRRLERLVEAEERGEREDLSFAMTWEGDEPNA